MMYIKLCIMIGVLQATHGTSTSDSTTSNRAVSHRDEMQKEFSNNTWINIADEKEPLSSIQCSKCCCPVSDADASASESRGCLPADEIPVEAAEGTRPADTTSRHRRSLNLDGEMEDLHTINIAVLLPMTGQRAMGRTIAGAVTLGMEYLEQAPELEPVRQSGIRFNYTWRDTGCADSQGLSALIDLWSKGNGDDRDDVDAFIGPACDVICEPGGILAAAWKLPMISYGCTSTDMTEKRKYPTFTRTVSPYKNAAPLVLQLMQEHDWTRVALITSSEHMWQTTANAISVYLRDAGIDTFLVNFFEKGHVGFKFVPDNERHEKLLLETAREAKIFLLSVSPADARDFMLHASDLGMIDGTYAFITIDIMLSARFGENTWQGDDGRDDVAVAAFEGILDISLHKPVENEEHLDFRHNVIERTREHPFYVNVTEEEQIDVHYTALSDAFTLYGLALSRCFDIPGCDIRNAFHVSQHLFNHSFIGQQGYIEIDENGDAINSWSIRNLKNGKFIDIYDFTALNQSIFHRNVTIFWPGGTYDNVLGRPGCGWDNEYCKLDIWAIVGSVTAIVFVSLTIFIVIRAYIIRQRRIHMFSNAWKIAFDELTVTRTQLSSKIRSSSIAPSDRDRTQSYLTFNLKSAFGSGDDMLSLHDGQQIFNNVRNYRGDIVSIKVIKKDVVHITPEITHEINLIRSLKHLNVNSLLGACVEIRKVCLVSPYCAKGSLQDVLENDALKLEEIFKVAFAADITEGMAYLHQSDVVTHGRLKSSNVLIDSRWTCKLADIGMWNFRNGELRTHESDPKHHYQMLWTAPELLESETQYCSQKGDVYSYAIVLSEIITRMGPYGENYEEPSEIISKLQKHSTPPYRPQITLPPLTSPKIRTLLELVKSCWADVPTYRPSFNSIRTALKRMHNGKRINLVDQMMTMMERYTNNLEVLVEARTYELEEEQKRTEELLGRMLPASVANELKSGNTVKPEYFDAVTVLFSDIVGFTSLASNSTPLEVVTFLNDLYTCFDTRIEQQDVYKVETIGDAYMVASGLPITNGDRHAGEISTLALSMLSSVKTFKIKHRPDTQLQLRIGIHSGSVVAGVVGLKMPRYCLFGDTVNYASRMESSGLALRIHVSPSTKHILDKVGGYLLTERGDVTMKGIGTITTYFMTGKLGFSNPLPDVALAAKLEDHEFK